MANITTNEGIESVIDRNIDWINDTIKAMLVGSGYTPNKDNQFIDDGGANDPVDHRIAGTTDQTLGSKATGKDTTGDFAYLDAADPTFTAVASGTIAYVVIYKSTGNDATSKIIAVLDVTDTPANGGDITIAFAAPASGGIVKFAN
jgi:hypothetical protein